MSCGRRIIVLVVAKSAFKAYVVNVPKVTDWEKAELAVDEL